MHDLESSSRLVVESSSGVSIRLATSSDAAAVAALNTELGYAANAEEMVERLERLRDEVLIAEIDGRVVGWCQVGIGDSIESGKRGEIRGLIVTEEMRSRGIGAELVRAAEAWMRARGIRRLRVHTNVIRERAHKFYEREGFTLKKQQRVYEKTLGDSTT